MSKVLFDGPVNVMLEGEKALWFTSIITKNVISYALGSNETPIVVEDHRSQAIEAAYRTNTEEGQKEFADYFNSTAWVQITEDCNSITINLKEYNENFEHKKLLWLGVIHDGEMPVHRILWQRLEPVGETSVAFAAIVDD